QRFRRTVFIWPWGQGVVAVGDAEQIRMGLLGYPDRDSAGVADKAPGNSGKVIAGRPAGYLGARAGPSRQPR
ncbi:MAG: hypothetical protein AABZ85_05405, partial [Thermodesulfobacteriota bacterium]